MTNQFPNSECLLPSHLSKPIKNTTRDEIQMEQLCVRVGWGGNHGDTSFKMKALDKILILNFIFPFYMPDLHCTWAHAL